MPRGKLPDGFVDFIQAVIGVPECGLRCYVGADSHLGSLTIISVHDETSVVLSDREKETLILDSLFWVSENTRGFQQDFGLGKEELRKPVPGDVLHYCFDSWLWFSEAGGISWLVR